MRLIVKLFCSAVLLSVCSVALAQSAPPVSLGGSVGVTGGQSLLGLMPVSMNDADRTLIPNEYWAGTQVVTSSVNLTTTRRVVLPANPGQQYIVENKTTGGQSLTFGAASGSTVTVAAGASAFIGYDGSGYIQLVGNGSGGSTVLPTIRPAALWCYGDSLIYGQGSTNATTTGQCALLARDTGVRSYNYAVPGNTAEQIANNVFASFLPNPVAANVVYADGGANNNGTCGTAANCVTSFNEAMSAWQGWTMIPTSYHIMASAANASSGAVFTADTTLPILASTSLIYAAPGTPLKSSTTGNTLTFNIPSSASTRVGLTTIVTNAQIGTYTVSVDGTLVLDSCSGTTTFTSQPCGNISLPANNSATITSTFYRQDWAVTPNTSHTIVVTMTNNSNASFVAADWMPPSSAAGRGAIFVTGLFNPPYGTVYNTASKNLIASFYNAGLNAYFVDWANGVGGVAGINVGVDNSATATATCPASTAGTGHLNDCGQIHAEQLLYATEVANNYVFSYPPGYSVSPAVTNLLQVPGDSKVTLFSGVGNVCLSGNAVATNYACGVLVNSSNGVSTLSLDVYGQFATHGTSTFNGNSTLLDSSGIMQITMNTNGVYIPILNGNFVAKDSTGLQQITLNTNGLATLALSTYGAFTAQNSATFTQPPVYNVAASVLASASSVTLAAQFTHISGTAAIATFITPGGYRGACLWVVADGAWSTTTGGDIASAPFTASVGATYGVCGNGGSSVYVLGGPGSSSGAPTINPTGGQNNYAPIASPLFTGGFSVGNSTNSNSLGYSVGGLGLVLSTNTAATSTNNYQSPVLELDGTFYNGSVSLADRWTLAATPGSGSNPTTTLVILHPSNSGETSPTVQVPNLQDLGLTNGSIVTVGLGGVLQNGPSTTAILPYAATYSSNFTLPATSYHEHFECTGAYTLTLPSAPLASMTINITNTSTSATCMVAAGSAIIGNGTPTSSVSISPAASLQLNFSATGFWRSE